MLSPKEEMVLSDILEWDDVDDAILYLIKNYSKKGVANSRILLARIPEIVDTALDKMQEFLTQKSQASYWLMCQRYMEPDKSGMYFASMLPVCIAMFPNGNADGKCKGEREYFEEFLRMFHDKKQFSWEKDKAWADLHGYTDYLRLVESQFGGGKK